jgi:transcriptional regulator with XRE-family HTH domain
MTDKRQISSTQRSALARRILLFLRQFDPPLTEAELARRLEIARQTLHNWMWNKALPAAQHIPVLAKELGITEEELREDIAASRDWRPPIAFAQFVAQAEVQAEREQWPDRDKILPLLHYIVSNNWQDKEGDVVEFAAATILDDLPLRTRAVRLALIAQAQQASGSDL